MRLFVVILAVVLILAACAASARPDDAADARVRVALAMAAVENKPAAATVTYADAYRAAKAVRGPLVVFIGTESLAVPSATVCRDDTLGSPAVWVGVPDGAGEFWRVTMPAGSSCEEICSAIHTLDKRVNAPPVMQSATPNVGSCRCGQGQCHCYPASKCAAGQCPPSKTSQVVPVFTATTVCRT